MKKTTLLTALLLGLGAFTPTYAQDAGDRPENPRPRLRQGPPGGRDQARLDADRPGERRGNRGGDRNVERPPGRGVDRAAAGQRPISPVIRALDVNGDRVLDEREIDNASRALRKLDRNRDGQITPAELFPGLAGARAGADRPEPAEGRGLRRGPGGPDREESVDGPRQRGPRGPRGPHGAQLRDGTGPRHDAPPAPEE